MVWKLALRASDLAVTIPWSVGEAVSIFARPSELPPFDRHHEAVARDVADRGFYVDVPERPTLRASGNFVIADNPYRWVTERKRRGKHRVVAKVVRKPNADRLLVVYHCYAIPSPWAMERIFGLDDLPNTDVAYGIMSHHQRETYSLWPGSGLASASPACMLENLRSAVTGARTLLRGIRHTREYRHVSVLGYSIGGFLSAHIANTEDVDRVTLYCPVVSMARMRGYLGLLPVLHPIGKSIAARVDRRFSEALMMESDPLRHPLRIPQEHLQVIVQKNDGMTPAHHIEDIRRVYPNVRWEEFEGTHLIPLGRERIRALLRG